MHSRWAGLFWGSWAWVPALALGLQLQDGAGRPVAGARVEVVWVSGEGVLDRFTPATWVGWSSATGEVSVPLPRVKGAVLWVDHPAFSPLLWPLDRGLPALLVLPQEEWQGKVHPAPGEEGGRFCLWGEVGLPHGPHRVERCGAVAADGTVRLPKVPGPVRVRVSAPGFVTLQREFPQLPAAPLELTAGVTVRGTVVDCNGRALAGARVSFAGGEEQTAEDGSFLLGASALPLELRIEEKGVQPSLVHVGESARERLTVTMVCQEGVELSLLSPEGPFSGEVVAALRELECGTRCREERVSLRAEGEGQLLIPLPRPGRFQVTLEAAGWAPQPLPPLEVAAGQRVGLGVVTLTAGGGLEGMVVAGASGEALPGVAVEAMPVGPGAYLAVRHGKRAMAVSDGSGAFRLAGLSPGRYLVKWSAEGYAPLWRLWDVPTFQLVHTGVVRLGAGQPLTGKVESRQRKPLSGVEVRLRDAGAEYPEPLAVTSTDGEGQFRFPALAPGEYRLEAWQGRRLLVSQPWEHPTHQGEVLFTTGVELSGRLLAAGVAVPELSLNFVSWADAWSKRPILQIALPEGGLLWGGGGWFASASSGVDGRFLVEEVPPGPLEVMWNTPFGALSRHLTIPDAEQVEVVVATEGEKLQGKVVPAPDKGVTVAVADLWGRPLAQMAAAADGSFACEGVPAGPVWVEVWHPQGKRVRVAASLPQEEPLLLPLAAPEGEAKPLMVRFRRLGQEVMGVQAVLLPEGSSHPLAARLVTGEELVFPQVPPGRYTLLWAEPLSGVGVERLEQTSMGKGPLEVELPVGSSLVVSCGSLACGGVALSQLRLESREGVEVTPLLSGFSLGMRFSPGGSLPLGRVGPGDWRVVVEAGGQRWEQAFTASSGSPVRVTLP